jgi:hypothetical protein|tara:strand:+ start:3999 stop:4418 length:420 start_codon:yes stop_codon:yes gene_type:complete
MSFKCPKCGELIEGVHIRSTGRYDSSKRIIELLSPRNDGLRKLLKKLHKAISRSIPSDSDKMSFLKFLERIDGVEDDKITWGVNLYLSKEFRYEGKGYNYLAGIIDRHNLDRDKLKAYERLRYGSPPPITKIKEKDDEV